MEDCPNCQASDFVDVNTRAAYSLRKCRQCGLIFKHIEGLTQQTVQDLQDQVYYDTGRTHLGTTYRSAHQRLRTLMRFVRGGRLLEIGCATGEFLDYARQAGFDVLGVDASRTFAEFAAAKGLDVRLGRLEDLDLPDGSFDVVTMFHLIEHLEDPAQTLRHVHALLAPEGRLMVVTPNVEAFTDRMFGWSRPSFSQADHLLFFSASTLASLMNRCGFEIELSATRENAYSLLAMLSDWCYRALTRGRSKAPAKAPASKGPDAKATPSLASGLTGCATNALRRLPYALSTLFYPLLKPYSLLLDRLRKGHELVFIVRKPADEGH